MDVIDEEGRLFGYVNVIDALVVATILVAVVTTGWFFYSESGSAEVKEEPQRFERHVVVSYVTSTEVARTFSEGDTHEVTVGKYNGTLRIDDVYQTPFANGSVETVVSATVTTTGSPVASGDTLRGTTSGYGVSGTVTRLRERPGDLPTRRQPVLVETSLSATAASRLQVGDGLTLGDRTLTEISSVTVIPTPDTADRERVRVAVTLLGLQNDGSVTYGGRLLTLGRDVFVPTSDLQFQGTLINASGTSPPGRPVEVTMTVEWTGVHPDVADNVAGGDSETHLGATASVVDVATEPAAVVVTDSDGQLHRRDHPTKKDVTLTVDARAYRQGDQLYFHGRPLRAGTDVTLRFGPTVVEGTLLDVEVDG